MIAAVICWWLFGLWVIGLVVLFSVAANANAGVLLGTGGVVLASYLLSMIPKLNQYLPTQLTDGNSLIYGAVEAEKYLATLG